MKKKNTKQPPGYRQGNPPTSKPVDRHLLQTQVARAGALGLLLISMCGSAAAQGNSPVQLRQFIGEQVGGIGNLQVPATNAAIPVPPPVPGSGNTPYRYQTTEAKRYLGKLLFHDPVRTTRVGPATNTGQPKNLPARTNFGGTFGATNNAIAGIFPDTGTASSQAPDVVAETRQTGSCGSCHIGEAAGKAGQQINIHVDGEGRGYTDAQGNFFPRRRPQEALPKLRTTP